VVAMQNAFQTHILYRSTVVKNIWLSLNLAVAYILSFFVVVSVL
jgi:hypothetical protein